MAYRRMIHRSISISRPVNKLSEFAQLLFTWIVPHLDDFGKIEGNAEVVKSLVMPMSKRSITKFEKAIVEIVTTVSTVKRYNVGDKQIIEYTSFDEHQTGLNRRTKSKFPDNPNKYSSQNFKELLINSVPNEVKGSEEKRKKVNRDVKDIENEGYLYAWNLLSYPDSPATLDTIFYKAWQNGLPNDKFYEFVEKIINNPKSTNYIDEFNKLTNKYLKDIKVDRTTKKT